MLNHDNITDYVSLLKLGLVPRARTTPNVVHASSEILLLLFYCDREGLSVISSGTLIPPD